MASEDRQIELIRFTKSIDDMVASKYIFAEKKISAVLQAIVDSKQVYNLIARCMVNFSFKMQWKVATQGNSFKLPSFNEDKVAFIFCLLKNIDDKKINFSLFLDRFFVSRDGKTPYENFCMHIILPFRSLVFTILEQNGEIILRTTQKTQPLEKPKTFGTGFDQLSIMLQEFAREVERQNKLKNCPFKKDEMKLIIEAFANAASKSRPEYFKSFMIVISKSLESCKALNLMLSEICKLASELIEE